MNLPELQAAFLREWPVDRVERMTLDEYTNRDQTSFTYWLEFKTRHLGSIRGGSSLKFKVYNRKNRESDTPRSTWKTDGVHAWLGELGDTAEAAFERVRPEILKVIRAAHAMDLDAISECDFFGPALNWKIASMYHSEAIYPVFTLSLASRLISFIQPSSPAPTSLVQAQQRLSQLLQPGPEGVKRFHEVMAQASQDERFEGANRELMDDYPDLDLLAPELGQRWLVLPSDEEWGSALQFAHHLVHGLGAKPDEPRVVVTLRQSSGRQRFAVIIGGQLLYSLEFKGDGRGLHRFQIPHTVDPLPEPLESCGAFQPSIGSGQMVTAASAEFTPDPQWMKWALEVAKQEWDRVSSSPYKQQHLPFLQDIIADPERHEAFIEYVRAPLDVKLKEVYKRILVVRGIQDEHYKWEVFRDFRKDWNLEVEDFSEMRSVMKFDNLMHSTANSFWSVLWEDPEEARTYFQQLFDSGTPIEDRLNLAHNEGQRVLIERRPEWKSSAQDERTLSVLWFALDPEHHAPYKSSFYKNYCQRADIEPAKVRQAYPHYLQLLDAFIESQVKPDEELLRLHAKALGDHAGVADPAHHLLGQNMWYKVFDQVWNAKPDHSPLPEEHAAETLTENPAPEPFMYNGELFDPEKFKGTYWILKTGEDARFWPQFREEGVGGMVYENWPNLKEYESREAITAAIPEREPTWSGNNYNHTLALWEFSSKVKEGDIFFAAVGRNHYLGVGIVTSEYAYDGESELNHFVGVDWVRSGKWDVRPGFPLALKTLLNISQYDNERDGYWPRRLLAQLFNNLPSDAPEVVDAWRLNRPSHAVQRMEPDVAQLKDSFLEEGTQRAILTALRAKKNIILQGPPGTGKTFVAKRLARAMMGLDDASRIETVQFHQSYSYEDFIQGYRPKRDGGFERRDGVFHRFCEKARQDPGHDHFFIIDEINRGNLSKIFGELMMLIEADKRGEAHQVQLTYSEQEEHFFIPENVHIIGTMNTADRSLAMVDYALRRRFAFFNLPPTFNDKFAAFLKGRGLSQKTTETIQSKLNALNAVIESDANLGSGFMIGHSYFCSGWSGDEWQWFLNIIDYEVGPQLLEFWFDDLAKAEEEIAKLKRRD